MHLILKLMSWNNYSGCSSSKSNMYTKFGINNVNKMERFKIRIRPCPISYNAIKKKKEDSVGYLQCRETRKNKNYSSLNH